MYITKFIDLLAPRRCGGCGEASQTPACVNCYAQLAAIPPVREELLWSAFEYRGPVKRFIQRAKFDPGGLPGLRWLAGLAATRIAEAGIATPDAVTPVPLGRERLSQRGFNQALVLATTLADSQRVSVLDRLVRIRETSPQVGLDRPGRLRNMAGAFAWAGGEAPRHVWLVDDVATTGATTEAAKAALLAAGAARVQVVALAREI